MPKHQTFPTILDEVETISITFLKQQGYLKPNHIKCGTVSWKINGVKTSSISILVNTLENYVEFDYRANKVPIQYRVELVKRTANIGNGVLWFFECPNTLKLCRKLYFFNSCFLHREACIGAMYVAQTYSKRTRAMIKVFNGFHRNTYQTIYSKHFRKYYQGKPTKRYLKASRQLEQSERNSFQDYEALFLM